MELSLSYKHHAEEKKNKITKKTTNERHYIDFRVTHTTLTNTAYKLCNRNRRKKRENKLYFSRSQKKYTYTRKKNANLRGRTVYSYTYIYLSNI